MDTRAAVAAYVETHRDASHRDLARALGVSASSIDRACRTLRQATRSQCPHSREAASDAACVTQPDARKSQVRQPGVVIPFRLRHSPDAPSRHDAAPDSPATAAGAGDARWTCAFCGWRSLAAGGRCESCGWPR